MVDGEVGSSLEHRIAFQNAVTEGVASRSPLSRTKLTHEEIQSLRVYYNEHWTVAEVVEEFIAGESDEPREADPECVGGMSRQDQTDIVNAGRGHLLLEK